MLQGKWDTKRVTPKGLQGKGDSERALHDAQTATATLREGNIQSHLANEGEGAHHFLSGFETHLLGIRCG